MPQTGVASSIQSIVRWSRGRDSWSGERWFCAAITPREYWPMTKNFVFTTEIGICNKISRIARANEPFKQIEILILTEKDASERGGRECQWEQWQLQKRLSMNCGWSEVLSIIVNDYKSSDTRVRCTRSREHQFWVNFETHVLQCKNEVQLSKWSALFIACPQSQWKKAPRRESKSSYHQTTTFGLVRIQGLFFKKLSRVNRHKITQQGVIFIHIWSDTYSRKLKTYTF